MEAKRLSKETILRWQAGDRDAGEAVIAQFEGMITSLCLRSMEIKAKRKYRVLIDRDLLEDLKQECRIRIVSERVRQKYDFKKGELSTFLTWELRSLLSWLKRVRARRLWRVDQLDPCKDLPYEPDYLADLDQRVQELLCTLPADRAFVLKARLGFYGRRFDQSEIAVVLGKSRQSVGSYEKQALQALRTSSIALSLYDDLVAGTL